MRMLVRAFVPALVVLSAHAQSINVDFEAVGTSNGTPTPYYLGSAQSSGVWNSVTSVSTTGLRRWDGVSTGVSLTLSDLTPGCGLLQEPSPFFSRDIPGTTGQLEAFLEDRYGPDFTLVILTFEGLEPGDYVIDTIFVGWSCIAGVEVSVEGSPDPTVHVEEVWSGAFVHGENFARHTKAVTDGTIRIRLLAESQIAYFRVCGVQLNKHDQQLPGDPMCFGDGTGSPCPCGNAGSEGRGCQNSAGTGGAVLFATGTADPDTVVLRSSGELPSALSIFLQGNASITPVVFGDGLRCAGGTLRRLYTKSASGGEAFAPGPGDPSITVRSAQVGVPIPADGRRYYQVYYRDANPGFCPSPPGNTFNITSAVRINW